MSGQTPASDLGLNGQKIRSYEGSGVVRAAAVYIQTGPDQATRAELQKLLNLIFPDPVQLERHSVRAGAQNLAAGSAQPVGHRLQTVDCSSLFASGFPTDEPGTCFQYHELTVAGQQYRLYVPISLPAGDGRLALVDPIMTAIQIAVNRFRDFGPMPPADLVFTLLPYSVELADTQAAAWIPTPGAACQLAIFPVINEVGDPAQVEQIIAHELFHCFQYQNYRSQTMVGVGVGDWWIEGTAEFFGNVAFPNVNAEYEYIPDFDANSADVSLLDMDYPDYLFFQFMADQLGERAVIQLISQMPTGGGRDAQLAALAAYPDIKTLFQNFGRAYLDRSIADTGGGNEPVNPYLSPEMVLDQNAHVQRPVNDFVVERFVMIFPADTVHTLSETIPPAVTAVTRPQGGSGGWSPLPTTMQGCSERQLVWLGTNASSDASQQTDAINVEVQHENIQCDPCLVGSWQMDNQSFWGAFDSFITSTAQDLRPTLQSIDGQAIITFAAGGTGNTSHQDLKLHYTQDYTRANRHTHADANIAISGPTRFTWSTADNSVLTLSQISSQQTYNNVLTLNTGSGVTITLPLNLPQIGTPGSGAYRCSGTSLELYAGGVGKYIQYIKVSH